MIDRDEVSWAIKKANISGAVGHDGLSNKTSQPSLSVISQTYISAFLMKVLRSVFIPKMKIVRVIPQLKGVEYNKFLKYCRINLLPAIEKIFERII